MKRRKKYKAVINAIGVNDPKAYRCVNDDEYCLCRNCMDNKKHQGTCTHCFACIVGEKSMDVCEYYCEK